MSIDRSAPGAAYLPRRLGFVVRWRARSGLLPGQVSTAALVQTRGYRRIVWLVLPFAIVVLIVVAAATLSKSYSDDPAVVRDVLTQVQGPSTNDRFEVVLDDGRTLFFARDPGVRTGDTVLVRHKGTGSGLGLVVNGVYRPSTADHDSSAVGAIVFSVYLLLIASFTIPAMVWGRRAYRQIKDDLTAPLVSTRGRYLGSWAWRGLTGRLSSVTQQRRLNHFAGFPIAIEERPGEVTWFGAPIALLSEVRHFEQAIAAGTREVIISYHPNTRAIARLEASDGSASVDLQRQIDELHPETGLQLKVSRRRRKAHLPDF